MTLGEYISNVERLRNELEDRVETILVEVSEEMIPVIQSRIKDGVNPDNQSHSPYRDRKWIKKRQNAGLQTSKKDMYFTGSMVNSMAVKEKKREQSKVTVYSGVDNVHENKVRGLSKQEERFVGMKSDFITDPTDDHIEKIYNDISQKINDMIKEYL